MADWSAPILTTQYAQCMTDFKTRDVDSASLAESPVNAPVGYIRYSRADNRFEEWNGTAWITKILAVSGGGTGVDTVSGIQGVLGLGTMAFQNSNAINVTGGSATGLATVSGNTASFDILKAGIGPSPGNQLIVAGGQSVIDMYAGNAGVDEKYTRLVQIPGSFYIGPVNDAYSGTGPIAISLIRSGLSFTRFDVAPELTLYSTYTSLVNSVQNTIFWTTAGVGPPTLTTRSVGSKLVFYPSLSSADADFAIGIEGGTLWYGVSNTTTQHIFYHGIYRTARLNWAGGFPTLSMENSTGLTYGGRIILGDSSNTTAPTVLQSGEPGLSGAVSILANNWYAIHGGASGRINPSQGGFFIRLYSAAECEFAGIDSAGTVTRMMYIRFNQQVLFMNGINTAPSIAFHNSPGFQTGFFYEPTAPYVNLCFNGINNFGFHRHSSGYAVLSIGGSGTPDYGNSITINANGSAPGYLTLMGPGGTMCIWTDSLQRLRIGLGPPTIASYDTHGVVVGAQA
jgi:hypothetical protein